MDKLVSGSKKYRRSEESSIQYSVSARSLARVRSQGNKSLRGEVMHRTLSRISKASSWLGGVSADKKAEQMFSQLHTHVKGYPMASLQAPPDVKITALTRKMMNLDEVKVKGIVSVKKYKETPKMMNVRFLDASLSVKSGRKRTVQKKVSRQMDTTLSGPSPHSIKSRRQASTIYTDEISFSRFYDINYKSSRPLQFKVRFYLDIDSFSPKFTAYSFRLESVEQCHEWLRVVIGSIKQMHDFLKAMINNYLAESCQRQSYNVETCDRYAKCLLDLTFWLYGYTSGQTVENIELYEKFLDRTGYDPNGKLTWEEKRRDIMSSMESEECQKESALSIVEMIRNEIVNI